MSFKQEDENYWNQSDSKAFSFDDEDFQLGTKSKLFGNPIKSSFPVDIIFQDFPQKLEPHTRPLETLISNYSLKRIFEEDSSSSFPKLTDEEELKLFKRQISNQWTPLSVSKTVKLLLLGQPYSLHLYRSLALKEELLDEAIKSGDGNAILAIVLFLSNTLKKSLLYKILQTRSVAVSHYVQYLTSRIMVTELIDLLEMLGQARDAAMKQFTLIVQGTINKESKLHRLKTCFNNHFTLLDSQDKLLVEDYIHYLEWILELDNTTSKCVEDCSVLSSLHYLCEKHWNDPRTTKMSPWFLALQHKVSEHQFQWVILKSRSLMQSWNDIETNFLAKGWISGKKLKGMIPIEKIIFELSKHGAPCSVLEQYFEVIGSNEKKLDIAKQLLCHKVVIDTLLLMKDRQGIIDYKINLKPQSEEYLYAESVLKYQVKWKS